MTFWQFALGNLWRRPARSMLTLTAIAIGVAAIVTLTSIAWGFEASWQRANDLRGTDLIVTRLASVNTLPAPFAGSQAQAALAALPHVAQVAGLLSELLSVENAPPMFVFGWQHRSFLWEHLALREGRFPADDGEEAVLLGSLAAEILQKKAGDFVHIESARYKVVGVFESQALVESGAVVMTLAQMQRLAERPGKVNILNIKLDGSATSEDARRIRETVHGSMPGFTAITSGQLVQENPVVRIAKAMSAATILVAGIVGALGVFNTMLMSVNERTGEVGVLLALGWRRGRVMRLFLLEAMVVSVMGGILGVVLGAGGVLVLEHMALLRGKIDGVITPGLVLGALGLSILLGALGGLYPAFRASRMQPHAALRHE